MPYQSSWRQYLLPPGKINLRDAESRLTVGKVAGEARREAIAVDCNLVRLKCN